jgi:hypothetical protein
VTDRKKLLDDSEYFAGELVRRIESLQRLERDSRRRSDLQTAAKVTRRVRGYLREVRDRDRRRRKAAKT